MLKRIASLLSRLSKFFRNLWVSISRRRGFKPALIIIILLVLGFFAKSLFFAAFVNGRPISRLSVIKELEAQGGQSVLDNLVDKELIYQEAASQKVIVSKADTDAEIARIENLLKGQNLTLDEALAARGETRASLEEQIKLQKIVEAILSPKIAISDDEVKTYFDQNKDLFGADAKFEDVSADVKDQLFQQKLSTEYSKWISDLRAKAKIIYLLKF